jgi:hypothetical protein
MCLECAPLVVGFGKIWQQTLGPSNAGGVNRSMCDLRTVGVPEVGALQVGAQRLAPQSLAFPEDGPNKRSAEGFWCPSEH